MNGVILYADDDVLNQEAYEYKLFQKFNSSMDYSVLPITTISDLEKTISSISTFRALLLDWSFRKPKLDEDMLDENENPFDLLTSTKIYSLVYIYSRESLPVDIREKLILHFGHGKIFFEKKSSDFDEEKEFEKICKGITQFEEQNKHMGIPFIWSQAINQSAQTIFFELEKADPNWIKEIRETAQNDGGEPISEIIDVFQNILNESLIQNPQLRNALNVYEPEDKVSDEENVAKLYRRIFYSKLTENSPIMTGDIFKFDDNEYGILITPECEIGSRKDSQLEFLILSERNFDSFLLKDCSFNRANDNYNEFKELRKERLQKLFNNDSSSIHTLPSFPFSEDRYNQTACILFKTAFSIKKKEEFENKRTSFKLNSPYIHQLRQRYVSFFGRYGVPAIPNSLRIYNLSNQ